MQTKQTDSTIALRIDLATALSDTPDASGCVLLFARAGGALAALETQVAALAKERDRLAGALASAKQSFSHARSWFQHPKQHDMHACAASMLACEKQMEAALNPTKSEKSDG